MTRIKVEGKDNEGKIVAIAFYQKNQMKRIEKAIERMERRGLEVEVRSSY